MAPVPYAPIAVQLLADVHDTPPRLPTVAPGGSGTACAVHVAVAALAAPGQHASSAIPLWPGL
ncbi:MAG TPA: hypothetical protein VHT94_02120 [Streptosporangiaceae bacterium]|nr:hypothetical protein [Streptosporangiaceae bacterium]